MKSIRLESAPCLVFTAIGALAVLPFARADEAAVGPQPDPFESRAAQDEANTHWSGWVEGPAVGCGRPKDLNIKPGLQAHEQKPRFTGKITCSNEACQLVHKKGPKPDAFESRAAAAETAKRQREPKADPFESRAAAAEAEAATAQDINPGFSTSLYAQLSQKDGNVFFSPYSITEAMTMVHAGAKGNTAKEIVKALSLGGDPQTISQRLLAQRTQLMGKANVRNNILRIANALCVTGEVPLQDYQTLVRKQFGGELFSGGLPEINAWVKKQTEGNIEKILESLDPESVCVILNAVYFKGNWESAFKKSHTHKAPFQLAAGKDVEVDMMRQESRFEVLRNKELIAVELPYQSSCSMVLVMPAKAEEFTAFEASLNEERMEGIFKQLGNRQKKINLYLPKFKIETEYDLIKPMKALGMSDAFNLQIADFTAMYDGSEVAISQIKHKATLEVDEKGSVATAATAVDMSMGASSISLPAPEIRFDRPFIVMIRENTTDTTLFMGRISDPTK